MRAGKRPYPVNQRPAVSNVPHDDPPLIAAGGNALYLSLIHISEPTRPY